MAVIEIAKIQVRRGQEGVTGVPQLDPGEFGWAEDTQNLYIGKRIAEGANSDENARILTDKDLNNIFSIFEKRLSGSAASTSTYRYRSDLVYPTEMASTTTTIAKKLDNSVSLTDFGPLIDNNITTVLQTAINSLYANTVFADETIRALKIPAGSYIVSGVIDLPPSATLIGEGIGITTLVLESAGTSMFRTIDKLGNHYEQGMMTNANRSKNVKLSDMTLCYQQGSTNNYPLLALDNSENPIIERVKFSRIITTSSFFTTGSGIGLRSSIGVDESTAVSHNTEIKNCRFHYLDKGITAQGNVIDTDINENVFYNVQQGIKIVSNNPSDICPSDIDVINNRFEFVYYEAIQSDVNIHETRITSSNNKFYYVGNQGTVADGYVDYPASAIFDFATPGNVSSDDYFQREKISENPGSYYYNSIASGNAKISRKKPKKGNIIANITDQHILDIPLTGKDQIITIDYQLYNNDMSRKGKLTMNVSPDGFASVSDYYNYSEVIDFASDDLVFSTNMDNTLKNYISLTCSSFTSNQTTIEFTFDIIV